MTEKDIIIGNVYAARVGGYIMPLEVVTVCDEYRNTRWKCRNLISGRTIIAKSCRRFRHEIRVRILEPISGMFAKQWYAAKDKHPGILLLFRVSDFYECYGDDAELTANVCQVPLTNREGWNMAAFPHQLLESNLRKLLNAGHRVAVCDQLNPLPYGPAKRIPSRRNKATNNTLENA